MAHSLEVRVPYLDHHVVEFAATIPRSLKLRRGETKYIVKRIARGLVPDRIIDKPKKGFFNDAVDGWLTAQLYGRIADFLLVDHPVPSICSIAVAYAGLSPSAGPALPRPATRSTRS